RQLTICIIIGARDRTVGAGDARHEIAPMDAVVGERNGSAGWFGDAGQATGSVVLHARGLRQRVGERAAQPSATFIGDRSGAVTGAGGAGDTTDLVSLEDRRFSIRIRDRKGVAELVVGERR